MLIGITDSDGNSGGIDEQIYQITGLYNAYFIVFSRQLIIIIQLEPQACVTPASQLRLLFQLARPTLVSKRAIHLLSISRAELPPIPFPLQLRTARMYSTRRCRRRTIDLLGSIVRNLLIPLCCWCLPLIREHVLQRPVYYFTEKTLARGYMPPLLHSLAWEVKPILHAPVRTM